MHLSLLARLYSSKQVLSKRKRRKDALDTQLLHWAVFWELISNVALRKFYSQIRTDYFESNSNMQTGTPYVLVAMNSTSSLKVQMTKMLEGCMFR
jgi:hypothetical protein